MGFRFRATVSALAVMTAADAATVQAQAVAQDAVLTDAPERSPAADAAPVAAADPEAAAEQAADAAPTGEVVVTGSRIARRDYVSTSPIVTVGAATLQSSGSPTIEASLNQLPQVASSASASANFNGRGGQASINLRGLGQQRTLVLVDGRRLQPSNPDGAVDLNIIPTALIENVEVITGGASAVYGSDAVTGVVNLKLRRKFSGAQAGAQVGISGEGDAGTRDIYLLAGRNFSNDRGNIYATVGYSQRDSLQYTSRGYLLNQYLSSRLPQGVSNVDATNLPSQAAVDTVFARYGIASGSVARSSPFAFNTDGTLFTQAGARNFRDGPGHEVDVINGSVIGTAGNYLLAQIPLKRFSSFGHADFAVSGRLKVFAEALYTGYTATTQGPPVVAGSGTSLPLVVPVTNPFIPADLRAILASRERPTEPFSFAKEFEPLGNRGERNRYDVYQLTAGASGRFAGDLSWTLYGTYGQTQYRATELNYPSSSAINRLLAAPDGGASICAGGLNPFGLQPLSDACVAYLKTPAQNRTTLSQAVVEGTLEGKLVDLPAGELRFAAGGDYRRQVYRFRPAASIASGELANYLPIQASNGRVRVYEGYGELLIPVLKDLPLIRSFNLDIGYRYSDYDTIGGVSTYKADADWTVIEALRLRGGYSRAIRAPSVGELFTAQTIGSATLGPIGAAAQGDPCDVRSSYRSASGAPEQVRALCLAQGVPAAIIDGYQNTNPNTNFVTSGNTALDAEKADTYSAGVVIRPRFATPLLSRLSLSVDYYHIALKQAIGIIPNAVIAQRCFNADGSNPGFAADNYYCGLITRNATSGLIDRIVNPQLNLGGYETDGIDLQIDWAVGLGDLGLPDGAGQLILSSNINNLRRFEIQTLENSPKLDYAGTIGNTQIDPFATARPKWKATSTATWTAGPMSSTLRWRYIGPMSAASNVGTNGVNPSVVSVSYFDLDLTLNAGPRFDFRLGVVNLTDRDPPVVNTNVVGQYRSDPFTYDLIGRRFYAGVTARF